MPQPLMPPPIIARSYRPCPAIPKRPLPTFDFLRYSFSSNTKRQEIRKQVRDCPRTEKKDEDYRPSDDGAPTSMTSTWWAEHSSLRPADGSVSVTKTSTS